jgi:hypothetical protein
MMAVYRTPPNCMFCGEPIQGIYDTETDIIGDNFICWDFEGHKCEKGNVIDFEESNKKLIYKRILDRK